MPELDISTAKVAEIIILARDIDRSEDAFDAFIGAMTEDEQANLVAIMWIGRGTFDPDDWDEAVNTALVEATVPTAEYLKGSLHLADHLESGLEALGIDPTAAEDDLY